MDCPGKHDKAWLRLSVTGVEIQVLTESADNKLGSWPNLENEDRWAGWAGLGSEPVRHVLVTTLSTDGKRRKAVNGTAHQPVDSRARLPVVE